MKGLLSMNRYCCGTVLVTRLGAVLAGAGKSKSRRNASDSKRSPFLLMVV